MEIPDNVRQTLAVIAKYHFWILAAVVPAIALTVLWLGNAALTARINQQRQKIQSTLGQISSVTSVAPHPNEKWKQAIDGESTKIAAETLAEWQHLWDSQADLRKWPDDLGVDDFLPAAANLAPGGKLERKYLLRYQKLAPRFARSLPARLGVKDEMVEVATPAGQPGRQPERPDALAARATIETSWNPADQKKLYDSFVWEVPPTTTQVLVAQEELWVYGALCDVIGQFNGRKKAQGSRELPIALIDELAVGYRASKDALAAAESKRIVIPAGSQVAAEGVAVDADGNAIAPAPEEAAPMEGAGGAEAVLNPRFDAGVKGASEDDYRNLIYVDFAGKPLTAAQLGTVPDARMVHLVPFVFKGVVDQRELDGLLVALAAANLPVDVREVRINPGAGGGAMSGGAAPAGGGAVPTQSRRYDVRVELRGTVALATPPDQAALGPAPVAPTEEGA
ncbi:MAG: hypothetical protein WCC69_06825 [Pirellulales bacterium]